MSGALAKKVGRPAYLKGEDTPWTDEEDDRLLQMRARGATFKAIAAALGRSRASALGRYDRISGRHQAREAAKATGVVAAPVREPRVISLGGPAWSRPYRVQS